MSSQLGLQRQIKLVYTIA